MKIGRSLAVLLLMAASRPLVLVAADLVKADNSQSLNLAASWTNTVAPASAHRLIWNSVAATPANCTNTFSSQVNALGFRIVDPAADVSLVSGGGSAGIGLNASGLDLSSATRDLSVTLPTTATFVQGKDSAWNIPANRTVTLACKLYIQNSTLVSNLITWTGGGTVRLKGGSAYPFHVANIGNCTGVLALAGVTIYSENPLFLCANTASNSLGCVLQTGGSNYLQCADSNYGLVLGDRNGSAGVYDLSGGLLTVSTNLFVGPERQVTNVTSRLTVRDAGVLQVGGDIWIGGYRSVNHTATVALRTGGVLSGRALRVDSSVINGTSLLEFDGGTLRPTGSTTSFLAGLTQATLSTNGALIDTAGCDITIRQTLENAAGQAGRFVKLGVGALTLTNAAHSFTGPLAVSNGTLRVASNATVASTNWTVAAGATLELGASVSLSDKSLVVDAGGAVLPGLLSVRGDLALGGRLTVLNAGERQKIAQCTGALTGAFSEAVLPSGCVLRVVGGCELWAVKPKGTLIGVL